jgi:uncharacterized protein YhbP (UPF0306 family)
MADKENLEAIAREIIDSSLYMVLGTAGDNGQPWVSPVYFAPEDYRQFYWMSSPEATHSRNVAARPKVSIVVFNSQVPISTGQGVYMWAVAEELSGTDLERGIDVYSRRALEHGGRAFRQEDFRSPGVYRMYRATASDHWVLDPEASPDQRTPIVL